MRVNLKKARQDAAGSGRQSEKDRPGCPGHSSDTGAECMSGGMGVGREKLIQSEAYGKEEQ